MPVNTILGLFAKSPLKPLQEHASRVHECCSLLVPFFQATAQQQWDEAQHIRELISTLEKQADVLKREIRLKLPRGLFLRVVSLVAICRYHSKCRQISWSTYSVA